MRTWIAVAVLAAGCSTPPAPVPLDPRAPTVTLATFNVNYALAGDRETLDAVGATGADVVCLQETTPAWERSLRATYTHRYPHMRFVQAPGAGGLAVLSRFPLSEEAVKPNPTGWFPAWRLCCDSPLGELELLVVHLRPPVSDSGSYVSGYFQAPSEHVREIHAFADDLDPQGAVAVLGDFNESSSGALGVLEERGLVNALPRFAPEAETWRWPTSLGVELSSTLDHVVLGRALAAVDARVVERGRSDHLPVVVRLQRAP